jgi:hypothetical protein
MNAGKQRIHFNIFARPRQYPIPYPDIFRNFEENTRRKGTEGEKEGKPAAFFILFSPYAPSRLENPK